MDFFVPLLMDIKTLIGTKHFFLLGHFTCCSPGWVSFVYIVDGYEILSFQHAVGNLIWWGFQSKFAECSLFCFEIFLGIETTSRFEMCVMCTFFPTFQTWTEDVLQLNNIYAVCQSDLCPWMFLIWSEFKLLPLLSSAKVLHGFCFVVLLV